jgi:hypothetical protein
MTTTQRYREGPLTAGATLEQKLTSDERRDLLLLIRQRASVARRLAQQRSGVLLAPFDVAMITYFSWEDDERWKQALAQELLGQMPSMAELMPPIVVEDVQMLIGHG